jgi:hypothetical protein
MFYKSVMSGDLTGGTDSISWLTSSTAGAVAQFGVLAAGTKAFVSLYGAEMYNGLSSTIHKGLHKATGAKTALPQAKFSEEELAALQQNRKVFIAGLVSIVLSWLHYKGAAEMRQQMHRNQREDAKHAEMMPQDIERLNHWYAKTDDSPPQKEMDNAFKASLNGLYASHPYYVPRDASLDGQSYFNLSNGNWSARRTAFNLLIGLVLQLNSVLFGGGGIHNAAAAMEGIGLFEILCHALRLYGWAPLYQAAVLIQQRLLTPKRRSRRRI